jgi:hypothetical protein
MSCGLWSVDTGLDNLSGLPMCEGQFKQSCVVGISPLPHSRALRLSGWSHVVVDWLPGMLGLAQDVTCSAIAVDGVGVQRIQGLLSATPVGPGASQAKAERSGQSDRRLRAYRTPVPNRLTRLPGVTRLSLRSPTVLATYLCPSLTAAAALLPPRRGGQSGAVRPVSGRAGSCHCHYGRL